MLCGQKERRKDLAEGTYAAEGGSSVTTPGSRRRGRQTDRQTEEETDVRGVDLADDDDATRHAHVLFDARTLTVTATAVGHNRRCEEETRALPG